jgi:hypothetical protein
MPSEFFCLLERRVHAVLPLPRRSPQPETCQQPAPAVRIESPSLHLSDTFRAWRGVVARIDACLGRAPSCFPLNDHMLHFMLHSALSPEW